LHLLTTNLKSIISTKALRSLGIKAAHCVMALASPYGNSKPAIVKNNRCLIKFSQTQKEKSPKCEHNGAPMALAQVVY
jgi:hypothetical protein